MGRTGRGVRWSGTSSSGRIAQDVRLLLRGEIKYTKRFKAGPRYVAMHRQFLLITLRPHNGQATRNFIFFYLLLDGDRFEGGGGDKPREGAHVADVSDVMRRMVERAIVTMEGKPLFHERSPTQIIL